MNIYKYDITISASGPPLGGAMLGMPPNATTPPMGQPPKPPTPSDIDSAKRNQVNFVKKPLCISKNWNFSAKKMFILPFEQKILQKKDSRLNKSFSQKNNNIKKKTHTKKI